MADKSFMVGAVFNIMSENVILDTVVDGKRYVLRRDKYNWIWRVGNAELDDETFFKQSRENSYFRTFDALLRSVFNNSVRQGIVNLDTENVLESYENALSTVTAIGEKLNQVSWGSLDRGIYCPKCNSKLGDSAKS